MSSSQTSTFNPIPLGYAFHVRIQRPFGDSDNVLRNNICWNDWVCLLDSGRVGGNISYFGNTVLPCRDDTGDNKGISIGIL